MVKNDEMVRTNTFFTHEVKHNLVREAAYGGGDRPMHEGRAGKVRAVLHVNRIFPAQVLKVRV